MPVTTVCPAVGAESMLADMLWKKLGLLPTDPGYGFFRPHVRLFDPGWRGPIVRGTPYEMTADYGNDPVGLISRYHIRHLLLVLSKECNAHSLLAGLCASLLPSV